MSAKFPRGGGSKPILSHPSITTHFLGKLEQAVNQYFLHILLLVNDKQTFLNDSAEGRRITIENISWSISTKVWDRARFELVTPGSAVRRICSQTCYRIPKRGRHLFFRRKTILVLIAVQGHVCITYMWASMGQNLSGVSNKARLKSASSAKETT